MRAREAVEPLTNFFVGAPAAGSARRQHARSAACSRAVNRDIESRRSSIPASSGLHGRARLRCTSGTTRIGTWPESARSSRVTGDPSAIAGDADGVGALLPAARQRLRRGRSHPHVAHRSRRLAAASAIRAAANTGASKPAPLGGRRASRSTTLGFMRSADEVNQFTWVRLLDCAIRSASSAASSINANQWLDWDFGGEQLRQQSEHELQHPVQEQLGHRRRLHATLGSHLEHRAARWAVVALAGPVLDGWFWVDTDQRRKLVREFRRRFQRCGDENSARFRDVWADVTLRPTQRAADDTARPSTRPTTARTAVRRPRGRTARELVTCSARSSRRRRR